MLKLTEIREAYEALSSKASDICRQIGFAGIGVIWILHNNTDISKLDQTLSISLLLICFSLGCDILQYFISTGIWYFIYHKHHKEDTLDDNITVQDPEWVNYLSWTFWTVKILLVMVAYIFMAKYLFSI